MEYISFMLCHLLQVPQFVICGTSDLDALRQAFRDQLVSGLPDGGARQGQCISCLLEKQHCEAIPKASTRCASELLELVHSDLCGPMQTQSLGGALYFMPIVDDSSGGLEVAEP